MRKQNKTSNQDRIAIIAGLRTPFARQATAFEHLTALELGQMVVSELMLRHDLEPNQVEQLVFGQVIQMPAAPNIAREIVLGTGMSVHTDAYSVTRACATSLQAVVSVAESIMAGKIEIGIAGGADSASVLPIGVSRNLAHSLVALNKAKTLTQKIKAFKGIKTKDLLPVPPAISEYSTGLTMGQTAEQMAKAHGISRERQDAFAMRSHQLAARSWEQGWLDGEVMVAHFPPYKEVFENDNNIRADITLEQLAKLKPTFDKKHGTVTAATSTPLTDGSSAVILMKESKALALGYKPLAYLKGYAFAAIDVWQDMLMGPSYATPKVLNRLGMTLKDIDLIEMHEAFSAQTLANIDMFASRNFAKEKLGQEQAIGEIDMDKFNVMGGSLAYGHPFAATGTRMLTQLCGALKRRGGGVGLTTACAAGGLGAAMIVEVES